MERLEHSKEKAQTHNKNLNKMLFTFTSTTTKSG